MIHRICAVAVVALLGTTGAEASVVFDTVTTGSPSGYSGPQSDGSGIVANSFTVPGTPDFASISVALLADSPQDGGSVMVYLVPDDGSGGGLGIAGSADFSNAVLIGTIADSSLSSTQDADPTIVTLSNIANPFTAVPDQEYWIALDESDSSAEFVYNPDATGVGTNNQASYSDANGTYSDSGVNGQGAFEAIVVTADTSNVPEPASLALLGGALTALGYVRRRKSSRNLPAA